MKFIKKLKQKFNGLSFRNLLILLMVGVTSLLLILIGTIMVVYFRNYVEEEYKENHDSYMALFSDFLGNEFEVIVDDARSLLENGRFVSIMEDNQKVRQGSLYFATDEQIQIDRTITNLVDNNEYIRAMLVVSNSGKFRYIAKRGNATMMYEYYRDNSLLNADWIAVAQEAMGKEVVLSWNVLDEEDKDNLSIVKQLINPATQKGMGYLVITLSPKIITQTLASHGNILENNRYFIVNPKAERGSSRYLVYANNLEDENLEAIMQDYYDGKEATYVYGSHYEEISGWDIVSVIPKTDLDAATYPIRMFITLCVGLSLLICIPLSSLMVSRINKPLNQMKEAIQALAGGDYRPEIAFDDSEIGKVGQYLLETSRNNLELREKLITSELNEKEAELLLLQERINPHFLYNTLDAIYFMAVIDEADDVAEMVKCLSEVFRLSLNNGDKLISVGEEMKRIRAYMKIQNMRYQDKFMLEIDVDEEILSCRILTFLLQPVVENAVIHGLEPKVGSGTVSIVGYREQDDVRITIHDNGVGIRDIGCIENGYGIKNIRERIRMYYGEEYDVSIESEPGEGTTVFFRFPA